MLAITSILRLTQNSRGRHRLVTIVALDSDREVTVSWHGTEERVVSSEDPTPVTGVGTPTPTPLTEIVAVEGTITTISHVSRFYGT